ncbi:MAG: hypothetical protein AAF813_07575 [Pseudomonadota bacterium]
MAASPVASQDQFGIAIPMGGVNDHFDEDVKTSGGVLVGLSFAASPSLSFDPNDIRIAMPEDTASVVCVRGVSRDGFYWTRTPYQIAPNVPPVGPLKLDPFTTKYVGLLDDYKKSDVAIVAFAAPDERCFDEDALFLPEVPADVAGDVLQVKVNSGGRKTSVSWLGADSTKISGGCQPVDQVRIAFDTLCSIERPPVVGVATLEIALDDGLQTIPKQYKTLLPAR